MTTRSIIWLLAATVAMQSLDSYGGVLPFMTAADLGQLSEEEERVWGSGREFDEMLRKNGSLYQDESVERYVQSVADRLFPEFVDHIHIRLIRSPQLNAFALPNGSIYLNLGMLARMENEAQLAALIGHEGTHFIYRHGFQSQQGVKNASAFALGVAMLGIPIFGDLLAMSSVYGFSREKESEADNVGYQRMVRADYDPRESVKVFEHLMAEVKVLDIKEPFFFSSHPRLQERVDNYRKLIDKGGVNGETRQEIFLEKTRKVRLDNLENEISMNRFKSVLLELEDEKRRADYAPEAQYYLGEAYRQRGNEGDDKLAEQFYGKAITDAPQFVSSYRALGLLCLKRGDYQCATQNFEKYLMLAADAKDVVYVRQYYEMAIKGVTKQ
ncbi:MAG: M48 family metalloprotease [Nitrosomonadales bacterium]|nr:M48 family metalloprotease [Nitrosomonadales bacterium]